MSLSVQLLYMLKMLQWLKSPLRLSAVISLCGMSRIEYELAEMLV